MTDRSGGQVLVVGAGPTGLTAALLLADSGVPSTVVDRAEQPHPLPRAVHLDGEGVRILQRLGLAEAFAAVSRPAAGLRLLDARARPFAEFRRDTGAGRHGHAESHLFDQPDLERLLRAAATAHPLVTMRTGVEVAGLAQAPATPVRVTLRAGADTTCLDAAAVLGCDGAGSTVRTAIGAHLRDLRFTQRWFVVDVRSARPLPTWGGVDQLCDPRRAATFLPLPEDRYRFEFRMLPGETAAELARPHRLAELTAPWRADGAALEIVRAAEYTFRARVAQRWRRGRVLLLGDAAHLTPPFIGEGLGLGLRDAHNLAWKLAAVLRGTADESPVLDSYQRERAPHAEAVIRGAIRVGRAMTGGSDFAAALRRPLAGLLLRVPMVRARAQHGIVARYPAGPDVERRRHRRDLPGTVCPQPVVRVDGRAALLDDVLGVGWALIAAGAVPPGLAERARRLGARTVRLVPDAPDARDGPDAAVVDDAGALRAWLRAGRAGAALLRPDRVVAATVPSRTSEP
ncbi:MAG TPA: bifunctional 3-(3-hydroxy-phenyl)propionate/3-hydroxycinnamic acid hydroxylase [Pseudonocardia sp.]|nr:bifunctional 3-(3-hydroxy-phenyl)propionate/3-hydroxycinnamic acid hydroxylase [Pseudonocardia sp.]